MEREKMTTAQVARLAGVSTGRARQYARTHGLYEFGRSYVWTKDDLQGLIARKGVHTRLGDTDK
jgi:ribosomal protein S12 methylthiotransferase accessory factor YcaO